MQFNNFQKCYKDNLGEKNLVMSGSEAFLPIMNSQIIVTVLFPESCQTCL